jgi:FixJ family two-component response regulator
VGRGVGLCRRDRARCFASFGSDAAEPAAIVLTGIKMPGRDGIWLAEHIHAKWPHTAIVMATGATEVETVMKSKQIGAVDYLLKPFGRELLRQALERAESKLPPSNTV